MLKGPDLENTIIARIQNGATDEFAYLVRRYQGALFRIVGNLLDGPVVEDIVQDVFLAAFAGIRTFDSRRGSFKTWLYRIARNHALNARKKKREQPLGEAPVIAHGPTAYQVFLFMR